MKDIDWEEYYERGKGIRDSVSTDDALRAIVRDIKERAAKQNAAVVEFCDRAQEQAVKEAEERYIKEQEAAIERAKQEYVEAKKRAGQLPPSRDPWQSKEAKSLLRRLQGKEE